jgi:beta propeller repeat protein
MHEPADQFLPPAGPPPGAAKKRGGCGCGGCLTVIIFLIVLGLGAAAVSYFLGLSPQSVITAESSPEPPSEVMTLISKRAEYGTVAVSGTRVVWSMSTGGENEYDVYYVDLSSADQTPKPLTEAPGWQYTVAAGRDYVAWDSGTAKDYSGDVYMRAWDAAEAERVAVSARVADQAVAMCRRGVVWESAVNGNWDIHARRFGDADGIVVFKGAGDQRYPRASDSWVVWQDTSEDKGDIWARRNFTGELVKVSAAPRSQSQADVDGDIVVWVDDRAKGNDIRAYDLGLGEETIVCDAESYQWQPHISDRFVLWADWRDYQRPDIYGKNLSTGREYFIADVVGNTESAQNLDIDGGLVAWIDGESVKAVYLPEEWYRP